MGCQKMIFWSFQSILIDAVNLFIYIYTLRQEKVLQLLMKFTNLVVLRMWWTRLVLLIALICDSLCEGCCALRSWSSPKSSGAVGVVTYSKRQMGTFVILPVLFIMLLIKHGTTPCVMHNINSYEYLMGS